ncbi:response regulator transcription factor [Vulcanococcus limneticus]|uniref:response regulator transcription factor n=1 Tax=Vulcanococcus limneticus TaxID=2170428 RepID=UPI000B988533|nr:response regulator transcription factor [Vulcanococcus limneticus]MCP9793073.1 response regulator transcription factor [Vulcanococcus limneticus MW73D5]MCP9895036.1 response regulator transcription factor [Vulcanococcus limneticus Candia 3F8]MCP9898464.1 response regulator transcription factor [Vulcanococcus limneticus Candia 3B3]
MRILFAEDDARLAEPLVDYLSRDQHQVTWESNGNRALEALLTGSYDLALLDWMLPGRDGLSIVQELRRRGHDTLVLMLTARDAVSDVVAGLQGGADDYLVKPFRMVELAARIRTLERRSERPYRPAQLQWGELRLDPIGAKVSLGDHELSFTAKELQLLEWFLRHPGQLFNRGQLLDQLWPMDVGAGEDTVKTHLNNLRRKVRAAGSDDPIETVHGLGYRLVARQP